MRARVKPTKTWVSKSNVEIENGEELLACRRIILKIVRYMKDNKMSQKDLDLKVTTVMRYGRILGLKLIVLPEDEPAPTQVAIYYTTSAPYTEADNNQFKYNYSKALTGIRVYN